MGFEPGTSNLLHRIVTQRSQVRNPVRKNCQFFLLCVSHLNLYSMCELHFAIHFYFLVLFLSFLCNFVVIFFLLAFCNSAKLRFPSLSAPLPSFFIESFFVPSRSRLHYLSEFCLFFAEPEIGMAEHQAQAYFRQLISAVVSDEKFFARDF